MTKINDRITLITFGRNKKVHNLYIIFIIFQIIDNFISEAINYCKNKDKGIN